MSGRNALSIASTGLCEELMDLSSNTGHGIEAVERFGRVAAAPPPVWEDYSEGLRHLRTAHEIALGLTGWADHGAVGCPHQAVEEFRRIAGPDGLIQLDEFIAYRAGAPHP